ncbi:MAG: glycosyltransferase family 39 protein [Chloroflexi bacterium]|nr:glycosyltransferase family 39 protein [Chloroflexota bacterium]
MPLLQNRFHPDEALYASFARLIASGRDPMLHDVLVDKPPLPFYTMAASMMIFGGNEFAARLPHLIASVISLALIYRVGESLYNRSTGALAVTLFALSPMAILFAITLFTDTMLIMFLLASILAITRRQWAWSGLWWGLAFACKQTAIFFLPLIAVICLILFVHQRNLLGFKNLAGFINPITYFLLPAILCALLVFAWDILRQPSVSFWVQGYTDNNPNRLIRANELLPRLTEWINLSGYVSGSRLIDLIFLISLPFLLFSHRRPSVPALHDLALIGFALSFFAGYWLFAFNVWDRYLLVLTPIIALLIARVFYVIGNWLLVIKDRLSNFQLPTSNFQSPIPNLPLFIVHSSLFILLLPPAFTSSQSAFPIGGDHGSYDGIDQIAATLRSAPADSVLYDYWLSWEWRFYLFDNPLYVAWMPDTDAIQKDLKAFGKKSPRYIVAPSWVSFSETQTAIESANFKVEKIQTTTRRDGSPSFTLYQIISNP